MEIDRLLTAAIRGSAILSTASKGTAAQDSIREQKEKRRA
jgi:hypothetical protein